MTGKYRYRPQEFNPHPNRPIRVHLMNEATGKSHCKIEHGSSLAQYMASDDLPADPHRMCKVCARLSGRPAKKRRAPQKNGSPKIPGFYGSWNWAKLRFEVLKTYGAVCMCCRATENIVVDHIKPRSKFPEHQLDFDNLQVLCDFCNRGKSNDDYTDFRPQLPAPELAEPEMDHLKDIIGVH